MSSSGKQRGPKANHHLNSNLEDYETAALVVPCPYCKVGVGERCWTLRAVGAHLVHSPTHLPHRARRSAALKLRLRSSS